MAGSKQPNIILILADQLRRSALGCYGSPDAATPRLDALARDGVAFSAACSTFPVCVPYRFTLMTGLPAYTRDVPCRGWRLSPAERTLADVDTLARAYGWTEAEVMELSPTRRAAYLQLLGGV